MLNLQTTKNGIFQPCWSQQKNCGSRGHLANQNQEGPCYKVQEWNVDLQNGDSNGAKNCLIHGSRHSYEYCKVQLGYGNKYACQIPHNIKHNKTKWINICHRHLSTIFQTAASSILKLGMSKRVSFLTGKKNKRLIQYSSSSYENYFYIIGHLEL